MKSKTFSDLEKKEDHARVCRDFAVRAADALRNLMRFDKDFALTDFFETSWNVAKGDEGITLGLPELAIQADDLCSHLQEEYKEAMDKVEKEKQRLKKTQEDDEWRMGPGPMLVRSKQKTTRIIGHEIIDGKRVPIKQEIETTDDVEDYMLVYGVRRPMMEAPKPQVLPFLVRKDRSKQ